MKRIHGTKWLAAIFMYYLVLSGCGQVQETVQEFGQKPEQESEPEHKEERNVPDSEAAETRNEVIEEAMDALSKVDMSKWQYQKDDNVFWQVGIPYCATPLDEAHENMAFLCARESNRVILLFARSLILRWLLETMIQSELWILLWCGVRDTQKRNEKGIMWKTLLNG